MEPIPHLVYSLGAAALGYTITRDAALAAGIFTGGVAIDIDHLPECWRLGWYTTYREFKYMLDHRLHKYIILILHSWEIYPVLLFWAVTDAGPGAGARLGWRAAVVGFAFGGFLHLVLDQFTNPIRWCSYFLSYRIAVRFRGEYILRRDEYQRRHAASVRAGVSG